MSDKIHKHPDVQFRPAGVGLHMTQTCPRCGARKGQLGWRKRRFGGGFCEKVCPECVKSLDGGAK